MSTTTTHTAEDRLLLVTAAAIAMGLVLRCISPMDPFPYWSADPMLQAAPVLGLTPARALVADVLTILATLVVAARTARTTPLPMHAAFAIIAVVAGAACWHARAESPDGVDNAVQGWGWVSSLCGAWALALCAMHHAAARAIVVATLSAIVITLVVKGGVQVLVEHPQSMASFRETREAFFAAQGWSPDSPMARAFVRRMEQPEASGWFGYANVFATLAAGGAVLLGALAWHAHTQRAGRGTLLALSIGALACAAGVALAGSKGGYAALVLGAVLCAAAPWIFRRPNAALVAGPAIILATQAAVIARGLLGERVHELSVLFRWFYMQAAVRIAGEQPLVGVGPSGSAFKDAYLLAKNPKNPEEIASPHNLPLDWIAGLGVAGMMLTLLWLASVATASSTSVRAGAPESSRRFDLRHASSLFMLICVIATMVAVLLEREGLIAETALVRLVGCAGAVVVGRCILQRLERDGQAPWVWRGLTAATLCTAAQCCIELTGVTIGAGAWCLTLLGVTATLGRQPALRVRPSAWRVVTPALAMVLLIVACWSTAGVWRWETRLRDAYAATAEVREFRERLTKPAVGDSLDAFANDLSLATGTRVAASPTDVQRAMVAFAASSASTAATHLEAATQAVPGHFGVLRALVRLRLAEAAAQRELRGEADAANLTSNASATLERHESRFARKSQYWVLRGSVLEASIPPNAASSPHASRQAAIDAFEQAYTLSPHEWQITLRLSDLTAAEGDPTQSATWAERALSQSAAQALDPLKQLPSSDQARLEARIGQ